MTEHRGVVIVGAGQAGISLGRELALRGADFVILDERSAVGDVWLDRWDSLRLFTPAVHSTLPGLPFPAAAPAFPTRDQVAGYLAAYAARFRLTVRNGVRVDAVSRAASGFLLGTSEGPMTADRVVIATGSNQHPNVPAFSVDLDPGIVQLHSSGYRNPSSLPVVDTLVVGAGTSGVQLAIELAATRAVTIAGRPTAHVPDVVLRRAGGAYWALVNSVLTRATPVGRKVAAGFHDRGAPLINVSVGDLDRAGVTRVPRIAGVRQGRPVLEDGRLLSPSAIVWATGYRPDFRWIDAVPVDDRGWPITRRGIVDATGLCFLGLPFQYALTSGLIGGVGRDAAYIAEAIAPASSRRLFPSAAFRPIVE